MAEEALGCRCCGRRWYSLEVDQDVLGGDLTAQAAPALLHLVVDAVEADGGAVART